MSRSASPYHHGNLPEALERAAMGLLETRPAHDISLREVAREAGVSHNAPYHHFGDRKALLKVLAERSMAALVESQTAAAAAGEPVARARALARDYVSFAARRPHAFAVIYDPSVCVPGAPTETMAPLIAAEEALLAEAVRTAVPDLAEDALPHLAAAMWGTVHGLAQLTQAGHLTLEASLAAVDALIDRVVAAR
ncbi:TetR/AcrR family transcriptional regulator [Agrococcus carbonis]|uniref:DNA-binding transcriptional regulator, AcrR family n=1 Tax=Agrococcus carbonis TaxID=684552 RepID=A0A1H1RNA9_9MICO|nr:TetR/AcrR family transcriptional regulator [Agrococcus carbonis]SDS37184.1 DNA-binding transcriptional regulator, AcrR family [Agrococcus carbonis]